MALSKAPDEDLVAALFEQQVHKCKALAPALVLYDASPEGRENRTTAFLYHAAQAEVLKGQREQTRRNLMTQASAPSASRAAALAANSAAPAPKGKDKGKGKGNGKSKGKDKGKECRWYEQHQPLFCLCQVRLLL